MAVVRDEALRGQAVGVIGAQDPGQPGQQLLQDGERPGRIPCLAVQVRGDEAGVQRIRVVGAATSEFPAAPAGRRDFTPPDREVRQVDVTWNPPTSP